MRTYIMRDNSENISTNEQAKEIFSALINNLQENKSHITSSHLNSIKENKNLAAAIVNRQDANGKTLLFHAAESGNIQAVTSLLTIQSIKIDKPSHADSKNRAYTPLCIAAEKGHLEIVKSLVRCGANIKYSNTTGMTPLSLAATRNFPKTTEYLACNRAALYVKDIYGIVLLEHMIKASNENTNFHETIKVLLQFGAGIGRNLTKIDIPNDPSIFALAMETNDTNKTINNRITLLREYKTQLLIIKKTILEEKLNDKQKAILRHRLLIEKDYKKWAPKKQKLMNELYSLLQPLDKTNNITKIKELLEQTTKNLSGLETLLKQAANNFPELFEPPYDLIQLRFNEMPYDKNKKSHEQLQRESFIFGNQGLLKFSAKTVSANFHNIKPSSVILFPEKLKKEIIQATPEPNKEKMHESLYPKQPNETLKNTPDNNTETDEEKELLINKKSDRELQTLLNESQGIFLSRGECHSKCVNTLSASRQTSS